MSENDSIKKDVLERIKKGEIKMKPKLYFVLRPIIFLFLLMLLFATVIYFLSFILFIFKINASGTLMVFGLRGLESIFLSLPWGLIILILVSIIVFEVLLVKFKFAWRRPVFYSLLGVIILFFLVGFAIHCTSLQRSLYSFSKEHALPALGPLYEEYERVDFHGVYCGVVSEISATGFELEWIDNPEVKFEVNVPSGFTKHKDLEEGDIVIVIGSRKDETINLVDLTELESEIFCVHRKQVEIPPMMK